ncbi:MAG TPA: NADH-quinone oxidoreductase subunit N [Pirellulales bacterium]|nr:NADH-quinone oxidoreductase subunit N [Pirellulales bacterium]
MSTDTVYRLLPEAILIVTASLVYLGGAFWGGRQRWAGLAVAAVVLAGIALGQQGLAPDVATDTTGIHDGLALAAGGQIDALGQYIRWLTLVVGLALVLLSARPDDDVQAPELIGTVVLAVAGAMLVATTRDLVLIFLGIELISIPTYVLLYLGRRDAASPEAAAKYFFLSILSSALTLYGFSFLYGMGGSTDLAVLQAAMSSSEGARASLGMIALVLIFAGIGFKITAVPFHFYAPDVYQGTTNGNAGVLAVLPKIAGFVALVRIVAVALPGLESYGWRIALVLSVLTMTLGSVMGLWQDNIRRLLAYSSIGHAGYMLIGLAVGLAAARPAAGEAATFDGVGALLFYLAVYALATTGAFAALTFLGGDGKQVDGVDELAGLGRSHPLTAIFLAIFMFSLAGIPPLGGFWGKFTIFGSALNFDEAGLADPRIRTWFLALAVIGVLNAAVAAAYYLRIISVMYFRSPLATPRGAGGVGAAVAAAMCAILIVLLGVFPAPLVSQSTDASVAVRAAAPSAAAVTARATGTETRRRGEGETRRRVDAAEARQTKLATQ